MMTILDLLDLVGWATWEPVWVPVLAWTVLALPPYLLLKRTDRLHPLAEYRLSQVLLAALPLGLLATTLVELWPGSVAIAPARTLSVTIFPAVEASGSAPSTAPTWQWTQAVGLLTVGAGAAALAGLARLTLDVIAALRVRHSLRSSGEASIQAQATRIARRLGTSRPFRARLTSKVSVPLTLGGLRPLILLPTDLADEPDALRMTLAHECIHVRRYDDLAHLIERIVAALFVAHPLVSRLQQHVAEAREHACDATVLNDNRHSSADYARLLLAFADSPRLQRLDTLSLSESPSSLTNRLRAMRSSVSSWLSSRLSLGITLLAVGLFLILGVIACSDSVAPSSPNATSKQSTNPGAPTKQKTADDVYTEVDQKPDCGGVRALSEKIQYPEVAQEAGVEGRVFVQFIVDETGAVTTPTVSQGVHEALDNEALAAVKALECEPGTVQGDPVKVKMTLPVTFKLPDDTAPSTSSSTPPEPDLEIRYDRNSQEHRTLEGPVFSKATIASLGSGVEYPKLIRKAGIEGTGEVTFRLGTSGEALDPTVTKSVHEALDARVLRSVQTTTFDGPEKQAADLTGKTVSVRFTYELPDTQS